MAPPHPYARKSGGTCEAPERRHQLVPTTTLAQHASSNANTNNDGGDRPCFQEARIEKVGWSRWRFSFAVSKAFPRRRGNRRANVEHNARQVLATNGLQGGCLRQWQRQTRHLHRTCAWRWSARTKRLVGRWLLARWELSLSATMGMPLCRGKCSASSERCAPLSNRVIFPTTSKLVDNGRWRWVP